MHGLRVHITEGYESRVGSDFTIFVAQRFPAVMAYRIDPDSFSFWYMTLGAFPGHFASPARGSQSMVGPCPVDLRAFITASPTTVRSRVNVLSTQVSIS